MIYKIQLHTPIGCRCGKMKVKVDGKLITGMLHILKQPESFEGEIDSLGNCSFTGRIVTLTKSIPYRAEGKITENVIDVFLVGGSGRYRVTGVPV